MSKGKESREKVQVEAKAKVEVEGGIPNVKIQMEKSLGERKNEL